jgi:spoIIIJ-associated protein
MRSIEGEGSTIDEAIARALTALGIGRDEVEIDILENASRGLLGIGRRKARVRATVRAPLQAWLAGAGAAAAAPPTRAVVHPAAARPTHPVVRAAESAPVARPDVAAAGLDGAAVLRDILRLMAIDATVLAAAGQKGERELRVEGPASSQVIGRRGEVLDALEYLINRIAERGGRQSGRFVLDAEGYRAKRSASLEELAHRLAERARRRGKPVTLNLLSPGDRRTVYLALQSENGIAARSIGQGFYRKLVIIPEGARRGGGKAAG